MSRIPFTLRIDTEERDALASLSKIEGRPINQLLNEAVKGYLHQRGHKERALAENLARLSQYRKKDPELRQAISEFVDAELSLEDPLEGEWFETGPVAVGPVQSRIRELLGA